MGDITLSCGTLTATSENGAGIGAGKDGTAEDITISKGTITASSNQGAGIGTGTSTTTDDTQVGDILISGTNTVVYASSTRYGAGIGGGYAQNTVGSNIVGSITVEGDANGRNLQRTADELFTARSRQVALLN